MPILEEIFSKRHIGKDGTCYDLFLAKKDKSSSVNNRQCKYAITKNEFCATGTGGGVNPTCSPKNRVRSQASLDREKNSSMAHNKGSDGEFTPERKAIHRKIIADHFAGKTPVANPSAIIMGGGTASGKSTIYEPMYKGKVNKNQRVILPENAVKINGDDIKMLLPEWKGGVERKDLGIAAYLHHEARYLADTIQEMASKGGYNSILDGTGNSSVEQLTEKVNHMRNNGQRVIAHYVTVSTEVAIARNRERVKDAGRLVPEGAVIATHEGVSKILPEVIKQGLFDEVDLWDTENLANGPVQVMKSKHSKTEILNQELWQKFLQKGKSKK